MSLIFDNPDYNNILDDINSNKNINRDNVCAICRDNLLIQLIYIVSIDIILNVCLIHL